MQHYLTGIPRNEPLTLFVELPRLDPRFFVIEPTFALGDEIFPGDFQIAIDDGPFLNMTNLPYSGFTPPEKPARRIELELEAEETDGAFIKIQAIDMGYLLDEDGVILTDEDNTALRIEDGDPAWWGDQSWALITSTTNAAIASIGSAIAALNDISAADVASVIAAYAATQIESYSALGQVPTRDQLLVEIHALLARFAFTGAVQFVKKIDGSEAMTFELDSATTPTSHTRTG